MRKLPRDLQLCVDLDAEARRHSLALRDLSRLVQLCRAAKRAVERECSTPGYSADDARHALETYAAGIGLRTDWPGLWPLFTRDGTLVRLPA